MLRAIVEQVDGRVPVLTGVAECTTALACRFAADARKAGVDGLMVLPAMVYKSDPRETIAHFRAVARATDLPIMVYNNPVSYGVDITPAMFAELADEPHARRHQGIVGKRPPHHRPEERLRRPLPPVLRRRRPGPRERACSARSAGWRAWSTPSPRRRCGCGTWRRPASIDEAVQLYRWFTPLLHLDTHVKLVQYIKLARPSAATAPKRCAPAVAAGRQGARGGAGARPQGDPHPARPEASRREGGA